MDEENIKQQILKYRFKNTEKTYSLCLKLLDDLKTTPDSYLEAFAYTYLGDYYIGQNDIKEAMVYLSKAKTMMEEGEHWQQLLASVHSFLGIVYEIDGDEQNAIQNYLEGMRIAKDIHDKYLESINLNNLAVIFQRHCHFDKALEYCLKAYELQKDLTYFPSRSFMACNIGDLYILMNEKEKVLEYYRLCEEAQDSLELKELYHCRNQCCYEAYIQEKEKAEYWAKQLLDKEKKLKDYSDIGSFDKYHMLCLAMFKIENKEYVYRFLELMEMSCQGNINELQVIEQEKLRYSLMFKNKEEHSAAYYRYYKKTTGFKEKINKDIVKSMKDKIFLNELLIENRDLELQQRNLEKEANLDEITGIYNRRYFELCTQEFQQLLDKNMGVMMIDIDYFKEYNDSYGHGEGDKALRIIGDCLKNQNQENIIACRFGGDEFACFCKDVSLEIMEEYIVNVRKTLYDKYVKHEHSRCSDRLTLSIGYAFGNTNDVKIYDLLTMADEALYESKLMGRNTYKKKRA